ncbi:MAG: PfkB family carbohydrate kinase [Planctomycetia bacterium]|nr:PfkB family carbohydrate kinase [Planctomycetia bacterium]
MTGDLPRLVDAFAGLDVVVIGEAMLDTYLEGTTGRLCREAPVPIVDLTARQAAPGGAANTAVNARALGARVSFLSVVGDDTEGESLLALLAERGIETDGVRVEVSRRTLAKQRIVAGGQLLVRFDHGDTGPVALKTERQIIDRLSERFARCDAVIVSDYGYGVLSPRVIAALARLQEQRPRVVVVDAKELTAYRGVAPTAIKPNYDEAAALLGLGRREGAVARAEAVEARGGALLERTGARIAAVTLDADGAIVLERDRLPYRTYARPTHQSRAAGAGDTFVAALALALAAGAETPAVADLASAAAAVVVGRVGTAACSAADLRARVAAGDKPVGGSRTSASPSRWATC